MRSYRPFLVWSALGVATGACSSEATPQSEGAGVTATANDPPTQSAPSAAVPPTPTLPANPTTAVTMISGAATDEPDATGSSGGGTGNPPGGMTNAGGLPGTGGTAGETTTAGAAGSGVQTGMGGVANPDGQAGADAGVVAMGGSAGSGEEGVDAGTSGTGGSAGSGGPPLQNPPVLSAGCGEAPMMTTGSKMIMSSGDSRHYNITVPTDYDADKAYRVIYASHGLGGDGDDITRENYYGLERVANDAGDPAIFVAPSGLDGAWGEKDHPLFDDILALIKQSLCIDTTRVFVTGFSFGGMYSYSLSLNHQTEIRAAIGMGPANYNIWLPPKTHEPIAWMQTTGMSDGTTPWVNGNSTTQGAKYIAIEHATDNGCMLPADIPTWQSGDPLCYDFLGCESGYPVKACTFDGGHSLIPGASQLVWEFITQF